MIPKILSVIWVGPHLAPAEMIESWEKAHPGDRGWFFALWRDHTGWKNQDQINARAARNEWNGVADCMRAEILEKTGGFCVDADSTCLKALDEGPEKFVEKETALAAWEHEGVRPGIVGCGLLASPKDHPFFKACVEEIAKADASQMAWRAVGPMCITRVAQSMPDKIEILPSKMFHSPHYSGATALGNHPIYATQGFGSTRGYGSLRKRPCQCKLCWTSMLNAPWC